jgi:iron-sulfur cluster repair protein YtfE (RIC family)
MENDEKLLVSLNKFTNYHKTSIKFLDTLKKIIDGIDDEKAWFLLKTFEETSKTSIMEHFEFEERIVFPAVLMAHSSLKSIEIVMDKVKHHGMITEKVEQLQAIVSEASFPLDDEKKKKLIAVLESIRDMLSKHMKNEDETILKIMKQSKTVRSRMAQYLLDL